MKPSKHIRLIKNTRKNKKKLNSGATIKSEVHDLISVNICHLEILHDQFDDFSDRMDDEFIYSNLKHIQGGMKLLLIHIQTAKNKLKRPIPEVCSGFNMIETCVKSTVSVLQSLSLLFSEDNKEKFSDEIICTSIKSLKKTMCKIDGLVTSLNGLVNTIKLAKTYH